MPIHRQYSSFHNSLTLTISQIAGTDTNSQQQTNSYTQSNTNRTRTNTISKFVQVNVGPAGELRGYFSSEADLRQIPYFDSLFDSMAGVKFDSIKLPDVHPGAFGQLLYFTRTGEFQYDLEKLCKHSIHEKIFSPRSSEIVKTYTLAKKFGVEECMNAASDSVRNALTYIKLTAGDMLHVIQNCDAADPLFRLSMQVLASDVNAMGWSRWRDCNNVWYQAFTAGEQSTIVLLNQALAKYQGAEHPPAGEKTCIWHSHTTTPPCIVAGPTAPEADLANMAKPSFSATELVAKSMTLTQAFPVLKAPSNRIQPLFPNARSSTSLANELDIASLKMGFTDTEDDHEDEEVTKTEPKSKSETGISEVCDEDEEVTKNKPKSETETEITETKTELSKTGISEAETGISEVENDFSARTNITSESVYTGSSSTSSTDIDIDIDFNADEASNEDTTVSSISSVDSEADTNVGGDRATTLKTEKDIIYLNASAKASANTEAVAAEIAIDEEGAVEGESKSIQPIPHHNA